MHQYAQLLRSLHHVIAPAFLHQTNDRGRVGLGIAAEFDTSALGAEIELGNAGTLGNEFQFRDFEQVFHRAGQQSEAVDHFDLQVS